MNKRRRNWLIVSFVTILLLPVLYVASFGPALWMSNNLWIRSYWIARVYGPLLPSERPENSTIGKYWQYEYAMQWCDYDWLYHIWECHQVWKIEGDKGFAPL